MRSLLVVALVMAASLGGPAVATASVAQPAAVSLPAPVGQSVQYYDPDWREREEWRRRREIEWRRREEWRRAHEYRPYPPPPPPLPYYGYGPRY